MHTHCETCAWIAWLCLLVYTYHYIWFLFLLMQFNAYSKMKKREINWNKQLQKQKQTKKNKKKSYTDARQLYFIYMMFICMCVQIEWRHVMCLMRVCVYKIWLDSSHSTVVVSRNYVIVVQHIHINGHLTGHPQPMFTKGSIYTVHTHCHQAIYLAIIIDPNKYILGCCQRFFLGTACVCVCVVEIATEKHTHSDGTQKRILSTEMENLIWTQTSVD